MKNWKERWEKRDPVARAVYFGEPSRVDTQVYGIGSPAPHLISMIVSKYKNPTMIIIPDSHLITLIGHKPRATRAQKGDLKVFMDGASTNIVSSTARIQAGFSAIAALMHVDDDEPFNVRCLLSMGSLREIMFKEPGEFVLFEDDELWPELRHNTDAS